MLKSSANLYEYYLFLGIWIFKTRLLMILDATFIAYHYII